MKSSVLSQAGLLLIGGTVVLLIGALVKFVPETAPPRTVPPSGTVAAQQTADDAADAANDLPLPPNFPASLAQVVKLTRAGLGGEVVLAYVQNSALHYAPTADEMIYLHRVGVAEDVLAALIKHRVTPGTPPPGAAGSNLAGASTTPATEASDNASPPVLRDASSGPRADEVALPTSPASSPAAYHAESPSASATAAPPTHPPADSDAGFFFEDLAPYGDWLQTPDGEWVWQPTVQQAVPDWAPYRDNGQWLFTDAGWAWQSTYPWGWAPFHYGRWFNAPVGGWTWQPGHTWSPAWVSWRKSNSYFGWAPLPPGVGLNVEYALMNPGHLDYDLTAGSYTFVPASKFLSRNLSRHTVSASKTASLLAASVAIAPSRRLGIPPEEVAAAVHLPITPLPLRDAPAAQTRLASPGARDLAVYRPSVQSSVSSSKSTR